MRNNCRAHRLLTGHPWSLFLLSAAVLVAAISISGRQVGAAGDEKNLRVRSLEIVDSRGGGPHAFRVTTTRSNYGRQALVSSKPLKRDSDQ
jgi:hypothetical protein